MKSLLRRVVRSRVVRGVARPLLAPFRRLVLHWVAPRLDSLERQAAAARAELDGLDRYVPVVLNAIQAQNAMSRAATRTHEELVALVTELLERFEHLHADTLAELARGGLASADAVAEPKILSPDKLEAARDQLRLDLGEDHSRRPEHVHVDPRQTDGVDLVVDLRELPFDPGSVVEIVSEHVVSAFPADALIGEVLPHWSSLLAPGGTLVVVVADLDALVREYVAGRVGLDELRRILFGGPDARPRRSAVGGEDLGRWLSELGLAGVTVTRGGGRPYEVTVTGHKVGPAGR